ncbi:MAG: FHIPEP family type III secretion protein [Planctomycetes bacterium]|nr:FHIPEP family type III secretion protein [Planctomycetota bacterium]
MTAAIHAFIQRYSDMLLALLVVFMVGLLFVPIPAGLLDLLIATNLGASLVVLLVALYVPAAVRLPSFPTILLLTTLFRLALNICSTKLILLDGNAGGIIKAFGSLVVGGNFVVGAVVFLVLVIVQFVVINRGAERVAEVSARFILDALPGKQMSIDADLRNHTITQEVARARRKTLEQESKLYGAMTGAMKFVQGDAIAGIIISLINVVAGFVVGVWQKGLTPAAAAHKYTLLTIGDGLVSQIPALLICLAAGLVVTRVADEQDARSGGLARDLLQQLLDHPRALLVAACFLASLAVAGWTTEGFLPPLPFAVLSAAAWIAFFVPRVSAQDDFEARSTAEAAAPSETRAPAALGPEPVLLAIHPTLLPLLKPQVADHALQVQSSMEALRQSVSRRTGLRLPAIALRVRNELPEHGYALLAYDAVLATGSLQPERAVSTAEKATLDNLGVTSEPLRIPGTRAPGWSVPLSDAAKLKDAGVGVNPPERVLFSHMHIELVRHAAEWLGIQETSDLVEELKQHAPDLVKAVVPTQLTLQQLTQVLRALLREQVPVRDLRGILEALARWAPSVKDPQQLAELVRRDNRRSLCAHLSSGTRVLPVYGLDPELEELFAPYALGRPLPLESQRALVEALSRTIDPLRHLRQVAIVMVTRPDLRAPLRRLIEITLPEVHVASPEEVAPDYQVVQIGLARARTAA